MPGHDIQSLMVPLMMPSVSHVDSRPFPLPGARMSRFRRFGFDLCLLIVGPWSVGILMPLFQGPASARPRDNAELGAAPQAPPFAIVAVVPFVVEPLPFPGAPNRPDQDQRVRRLAEEASARAARSLVCQQIAGSVERVPSRDAAAVQVLVAGTVRLPVSLPPDLHGLRAQMRHGPFVSATVVMQRADGTILAREEAPLNWGDIRWAYGAKFRRFRPLDDILDDFVRKVVDRAIKRLREHDWRRETAVSAGSAPHSATNGEYENVFTATGLHFVRQRGRPNCSG